MLVGRRRWMLRINPAATSAVYDAVRRLLLGTNWPSVLVARSHAGLSLCLSLPSFVRDTDSCTAPIHQKLAYLSFADHSPTLATTPALLAGSSIWPGPQNMDLFTLEFWLLRTKHAFAEEGPLCTPSTKPPTTTAIRLRLDWGIISSFITGS